MPQVLDSKKLNHWNKVKKKVESLTDELGQPIDEGIKDTIIALRALGFPTTGSCQGHIKWGGSHPWIDINAPEPKDWKRNTKKKQRWAKKNLHYALRLMKLLIKFYRFRKTDYENQLILADFSFARFRLKNLAGEVISYLNASKRKHKLPIFQKEMIAFTVFLKHYYFNRSSNFIIRHLPGSPKITPELSVSGNSLKVNHPKIKKDIVTMGIVW